MKILLSGGSKSGKSMLAQNLTRALAAGGPMYYWAAMEPTDGEDLARIARHREERRGWGYETIEQGRNLEEAFDRVDPDGTVLFDSVTALLANEMFSPEFDPEAAERTAQELLRLGERVRHIVYVSDSLFSDSGRYDEWTECYRRGLGQTGRALAAACGAVAEVTAGIPIVHKGELP